VSSGDRGKWTGPALGVEGVGMWTWSGIMRSPVQCLSAVAECPTLPVVIR
jgi:hypothetical protein